MQGVNDSTTALHYSFKQLELESILEDICIVVGFLPPTNLAAWL